MGVNQLLEKEVDYELDFFERQGVVLHAAPFVACENKAGCRGVLFPQVESWIIVHFC